MRRNNVTKKHYVLAFVGLMLAAPLAAKIICPLRKFSRNGATSIRKDG